jgi:hypothetical protein
MSLTHPPPVVTILPVSAKGKEVLCMRNLLIMLAMALAASAVAGDLRLEDSSFRTLAYIRESGRIEDDAFQTIGYIREEGTRIEDADYTTLGYMEEGVVENADYEEIYRLGEDGRITDSRFRTVARITSDGTVEDNAFMVLIYTDGTDEDMTKKIATYLIFFSDLLEQD